MWEEIKTLESNANTYDEDLRLRVWNEMVSMVSNNATNFCSVTTPAEIVQLLQSIDANSDNIQIQFLKESVASLKDKISTTIKKIETVNNSTN